MVASFRVLRILAKCPFDPKQSNNIAVCSGSTCVIIRVTLNLNAISRRMNDLREKQY